MASDHDFRCKWEKKDLPVFKYMGPGNWLMSFSLGAEPLDPWQTAVQPLDPFPGQNSYSSKILSTCIIIVNQNIDSEM